MKIEQKQELLKYLSQEEKEQSRPLWEEAFPEDTKSFDDYYYHVRTKNNRILVKMVDDEIVSMAHRNPYRVVVRNQMWDVDYVVGVATLSSQRKQGHMRAVLSKMLSDMYAEKMAFCYLMPASERIYLPFGFTYIYDQSQWAFSAHNENLEYKETGLSSPEICLQIGKWQENWLAARYQVYCQRDAEYMEMFRQELASEAGTVKLCYLDGVLKGMRFEWGIDKKEQRAMLCDEGVRVETGLPKPAIMGRIVHAGKFVQAISLNKNAPVDRLNAAIRIEDEFLEENNGEFIWSITKEGSFLTKQETGVVKPEITLTMAQVTAWLFGYRSLTELLKQDTIIPEWCSFIDTLSGVFLDEAV